MLLTACDAPKDALGGIPEHEPNKAEVTNPVATRIVSLDYCADQYLLKLVDSDRILAVSPDAAKSYSYMREAAAGLPRLRASAEDVLRLQPDLIIRSFGGGPGAANMFRRAGIPLVQIGYANDIETLKEVIAAAALGLGETKRGAALIADLDKRLKAVERRVEGQGQGQGESKSALYITQAGFTSGPGTLVHEMLRAAGFENFQALPGWRSLPLERLAYENPDVFAAAFFDAKTNHENSWSSARHPVMRRAYGQNTAVQLEGAWTACGGWFLVDAVEALAEANP